MATGTWYMTATGEITGHSTTSDSAIYTIKQQPGYKSGKGLVDGLYSGDEYYVNGTTPTLRTANPATIASQTISNIPNPSTVDCGELGSYEVTDGTFEFTIDTPGTYEITVISVPHFDETFEVVIT